MKYFHRTSLPPDAVIRRAAGFFSPSLAPVEESARRRRFSGALGQLVVLVEPEGGHYTRVTVETNQPGESELDRRAKRFLAEVHAEAEPGHVVRGAY
jgi:hypothetical protein